MNFFLVRAQELDLHRIIDVEVDLCKEWAGLEQDLEVRRQ
jgi:hypothetical protein